MAYRLLDFNSGSEPSRTPNVRLEDGCLFEVHEKSQSGVFLVLDALTRGDKIGVEVLSR